MFGHFILTVFGDFYPVLNGDFRTPLTMCLHFSLVTLLIIGFNVPQSADIVALGNGLGHVKAGIKAAADAVVIFPSFSGMSFSL